MTKPPKQSWQDKCANCDEEIEPGQTMMSRLYHPVCDPKFGPLFKPTQKVIEVKVIEVIVAIERNRIVEELKHIAMFDNGKEPKYLVKDVLDLVNNLK